MWHLTWWKTLHQIRHVNENDVTKTPLIICPCMTLYETITFSVSHFTSSFPLLRYTHVSLQKDSSTQTPFGRQMSFVDQVWPIIRTKFHPQKKGNIPTCVRPQHTCWKFKVNHQIWVAINPTETFTCVRERPRRACLPQHSSRSCSQNVPCWPEKR